MSPERAFVALVAGMVAGIQLLFALRVGNNIFWLCLGSTLAGFMVGALAYDRGNGG